ncbi:hypothetical protein L9F63_015226 [Diploptera punctata]|uniref:FATC domain-containing protein n=1 Tax=Diploptera punctata TaxID=6984 RepID=A0AAD8A693_DIPPU|nr:hypothetical protein L9F63_015226 [Diploptera punctata]
MEVFVKEPSMDWMESARRHDSLNRDSKQGKEEWYPLQKLDLAKLKFEGANPAFITISELEAGFKNKKYFSKYLEAAQGVHSENVRSRLSVTDLSPEQQVDCLLDQAMDYNILSKMWSGWEPWM